MANRCTAVDVKSILSTVVDDTNIEVFIGVANRFITEHLGDDTTLSDAQLKDIEMFLTAHIIASTKDPKPQEENIGEGDYEVKYQGETGKDLDATSYGQVVKMLDTTGTLAAMAGKKKASLTAVTSFD